MKAGQEVDWDHPLRYKRSNCSMLMPIIKLFKLIDKIMQLPRHSAKIRLNLNLNFLTNKKNHEKEPKKKLQLKKLT